MKYLYLLPLGLALLTASCKNTTTASSNPYQSNPYYGPSGTTSDYSSTPSSTTYPTYSQSTYTPPATAAAAAASPTLPSVPAAPAYSANPPSYSSSTASTYTTPYSSASGGSAHTVSGGENLYRISLKYGKSVAAIKSANGLNTDTIHPGQVIRIP